ncbi:MAG: folate family ECF transporter S component [Oscillospiraceae bacterium]
MQATKKFDLRTITLMGMLITIEIILSRFCSLSAWNIKIGFSFVPVVAAAFLLGPLPAGIVAALGDFVGALLFPIGVYFPGFTLTAFLTGLVFGALLHKKQSLLRISAAVVINQLGLSLLLNTLWISVLYGSPYGPLLVTRLVQCAVLCPIQFLLIDVMTKTLLRYTQKKVAA